MRICAARGGRAPKLDELSLEKNPDGSITLYFSPTALPEMKSNWMKTIPGRGWFCEARLYGPEKAFFDRTWRWGDFEKTK